MKLSAYIELLQTLPQDLEVLACGHDCNMVLGEVGVEVVHAKEDGDGVVRQKVLGYGSDYILLT